MKLKVHKKIGKALRRIVWPETCLLCDRQLTLDEKYICLHCLTEMPRTRFHLNPENRVARLVLPLAPNVRSACWFFYHHDSRWHKLIHTIKYHDRPGLAIYLGREFGEELLADGFFAGNPVDVILPIPLHTTRLLRRTYNQAALIARGLAEIISIPVGDNLIAVKSHRSQTRNNSESRSLNVEGIFAVRHPEELNGLHIAILDDVITTGATITAAANAIIEAGIKPASLTLISLGATRLS